MTTSARDARAKFRSGQKNLARSLRVSRGALRFGLSRNYGRKLCRDLPGIFHTVDGKPCVNAVSLVRVNLRAMLLGARCAPLFRGPSFRYLMIAMIYLNE